MTIIEYSIVTNAVLEKHLSSELIDKLPDKDKILTYDELKSWMSETIVSGLEEASDALCGHKARAAAAALVSLLNSLYDWVEGNRDQSHDAFMDFRIFGAELTLQWYVSEPTPENTLKEARRQLEILADQMPKSRKADSLVAIEDIIQLIDEAQSA